MKIRKAKSVTQQFRELEVGQKTTIDCSDYTAPHAFARHAGIKVKTSLKKHLVSGYRIEVTRIA